MKKITVAVIGVGAVGVELLRILRQRNFPCERVRVFARSERDIEIDGHPYHVEAVEKEEFDGIDIALFAGTEGEKGASTLYARKFIDRGAVVIDNGNDFRMDPEVPLVIPEANRDAIAQHKGLIANPNCTTIQMVVALQGIHRRFGLRRVLLTSFQATSGGGRKAAQTLWDETRQLCQQNRETEHFQEVRCELPAISGAFSRQIVCNAIPQIGGFKEFEYTSEEWKVVNETRKILGDDTIALSATCVRIPVFTAHSEAVYFECGRECSRQQIAETLAESDGVTFFPAPEQFPVALDAQGGDAVLVGRLRPDPHRQHAFWLWCVADNLRKGAALNAVQIAECLVEH
ncbi:MAG: aspartate-semialdehyde dehydrogenase [Candidatus Omnitrophica bacterium]|nr:aspartate-semialdehyde dehydrogenase [Candidatus Omnitrophota bacterium]